MDMRIGSLFGIEINVHVSWVFVFALVAWALANPMGPLRPAHLGTFERLVLGAVGSLLFFASVLVHELAHSLLARRRGIPVRGITLFIFGGVSMFEGEAADAPGEAWISAAGPLTSLLLGALFYALASAVGLASPLGALFGYLSAANIILAIFNIVPAYPLDGGRVLHALIWKASGNRTRATEITANVGRAIAGVMIAAGVFEALSFDFGSGLWLTFIGWFLLQAGNAERTGAAAADALRGHTAGELAAPAELRAAADATGARALALMRQSQVAALPVVLGEELIGVVQIADLLQKPEEELAQTYVTALMTRPDAITTVPATAPASDALKTLVESGADAIALTTASGSIAGLLTRESAMRWLAGMRHPS